VGRHTGFVSLPRHGGKAPAWLFGQIVQFSREIVIYLVSEFGAQEVLRLSDPYWFQAFGCVLGFDWHSSGVTTTVCGAVKEGIKRSIAISASSPPVAGAGPPEKLRMRSDLRVTAGARSSSARVREPYRRKGGQRRRSGRPPALPSRVVLHGDGDWCVVQQ
jgi:hypothetical protein